MISTNFAAVSAAAVQPQAPPASPTSAHKSACLLPTISSVASLVTSSDQQAALVKKLNHTNHNSNSSEKNKMTNFSIAAIMNNERGSSGLVRPMPASETKLGKSYFT